MVRFSLVGATMTRSSEEVRAWRGDGVMFLLVRATMTRSSEEMRTVSGESGEVLAGSGGDDEVVGGDASWER